MSVSTEVQRTLVKSPPELWSELGSAEGLARHLGEIGEIRVVAAEPESRLEWEGDRTSGIVELKQSGWGTKVTLSLTRELAAGTEGPVEPGAAEPEPAAEATGEPEQVAEAETRAEPASESEPAASAPVATELEAEPAPGAPEPASEAEPVVSVEAPEPEPTATTTTVAATASEPKQGFFARLFKRRRAAGVQAEPAPEPIAPTQPEDEPLVELHAMALPEPVYPDRPPEPAEPVEPAVDLGAELAELEAQMRRESTELLTGVLDRLGAAHHRPFSRA
jgi:hypothetical protein